MSNPVCSTCGERGGNAGTDGGLNSECPECCMAPLAGASDDSDAESAEEGVDATEGNDCPVCGGRGSIGSVPGLSSVPCTACNGTGKAPAVRDAGGEEGEGEGTLATAGTETEEGDTGHTEIVSGYTAEELAGMSGQGLMAEYDATLTRLLTHIDGEDDRPKWQLLRGEILRRMGGQGLLPERPSDDWRKHQRGAVGEPSSDNPTNPTSYFL